MSGVRERREANERLAGNVMPVAKEERSEQGQTEIKEEIQIENETDFKKERKKALWVKKEEAPTLSVACQ